MNTKKIYIMASHDWSMRYGMMEFVKFLDPTITYKGEEYKIELGRVVAEPIRCGDNLNHIADFIVDRTIHWNDYYKCWAQQAMNSQMKIVNHSHTFANYDKHSTYDLMARLVLPEDYFPTTVLLPQFEPYMEDQEKDAHWKAEQRYIIEHTRYGWDPERTTTDWDAVHKKMRDYENFMRSNVEVRKLFYPAHKYIAEAMEKCFNNTYPVFFKKPFGGGGSDVYKIHSLEALYQKYDETEGKVFHLQEAIEEYDLFIRCMAIGPQVLPMTYEAEKPLHQHYHPEKLRVESNMFNRLENYVLFINAYHRWTYNSFEALIKGGRISPIDFANACPDSKFTSLHVHFPWLLNALLKWFTFCAVTEMDMRIDLEEEQYLSILNDDTRSQHEKYEEVAAMSRAYFQIDKFDAFCEDNFKDLDEKMIQFYDSNVDNLISYAISMSEFPQEEHAQLIHYYKDMMENYFRKNAKEYLTTVITT